MYDLTIRLLNGLIVDTKLEIVDYVSSLLRKACDLEAYLVSKGRFSDLDSVRLEIKIYGKLLDEIQ